MYCFTYSKKKNLIISFFLNSCITTKHQYGFYCLAICFGTQLQHVSKQMDTDPSIALYTMEFVQLRICNID